MNDETTLCRCRDCGAEFSDEDTVPMQIQPGADVERGCPKCHSDWWEYVRDLLIRRGRRSVSGGDAKGARDSARGGTDLMGTRIKTLQESVAETSQRRQQVEDAIQYLQNYMNTYTDQVYYRDYSDETIVKDVLYGLGIALWGQAEHRGPSGFDRTVARIQEMLAKHR